MKVYNSIHHVAEDLGIKYNIYSVCNGNMNNAYGYHFQYYDPNKTYQKTERGYDFNYQHIKCVETGEVFNSIADVGKLGFYPSSVLSGDQETTGGFHWVRTNEPATATFKSHKFDYTPKVLDYRVICVEENKIFENIDKAAEYANVAPGSIKSACLEDRKICSKRHWRYMKDYNPKNRDSILSEITTYKTKKVIIVETGEVFNSARDLQEYLGIKEIKSVWRVLSGGRKTLKGYHIKYIED